MNWRFRLGGVARLSITQLLTLNLACLIVLHFVPMPESAAKPVRDLPDILIIVCDAARAENLSVNGRYDRPTTPNLSRLVQAGVMTAYTNCIASAMWTMPSVASLFSGVYPSAHRLVIDGDQMDGRFVLLPEMLRRAGYFTAKVTGMVPYVSAFTGLDRGFAENFEPSPSALKAWIRQRRRERARRSGQVRREGVDLGLDIRSEADAAARRTLKNRARYWATGWTDCGARACFDHMLELWEAKADQPRFIYMHLQETHAEYRPPRRFRRRFIPQNLRGYNIAAVNQRPNPHDVGLINMSQDDYALLTALYDACICYLDSEIGRAIDILSKQPGFDNTMILITADHGDCIGRHGILGHQFVLYDELVHIPFVVKWPGSARAPAGRCEALIQNVDVFPTIARMIGAETELKQCEGIDILSEKREIAMSELLKPFGAAAVKQGLPDMAPQYNRAVLAARSAMYKLITYSKEEHPDELYDLHQDPRETRNIFETEDVMKLDEEDRKMVDDLRQAVQRWRPRWLQAAKYVDERITGGGEAEPIDPEVEARLRALGYLD